MSESGHSAESVEEYVRNEAQARVRNTAVDVFCRDLAASYSDLGAKAQNLLFYEMMGFLDGALEEFDTRVAEGHYDYLFDEEDE